MKGIVDTVICLPNPRYWLLGMSTLVFTVISVYLCGNIRAGTNGFAMKNLLSKAAGKCPQFLYLINGAGELPHNLSIGLKSNRSKIIMLSYQYNTSTTDVYAPNTTWTQARNILLGYVKMFENENACRSQYLTFMDGDLVLSPAPVQKYVREYEDFLLEWRPAIGMPHILTKDHEPDIRSCAAFDAMFNSFDREVVDLILPYDGSEDHTSWWISQLIVIYSSTRFKDHVLTKLGSLRATNPEHNPYPRDGASVEAQEKLLQYLIPEELRTCVGLDINEKYDFWGTPKKKSHSYMIPVRWSHSEIVNCKSTLVAKA